MLSRKKSLESAMDDMVEPVRDHVSVSCECRHELYMNSI